MICCEHTIINVMKLYLDDDILRIEEKYYIFSNNLLNKQKMKRTRKNIKIKIRMKKQLLRN